MSTSNAVQQTVLALRPRTGLRIGLWVGQVLLAGMFLMAGFMKTTMPVADLAQQGLAWTTSVPEALVRFIGLSEIAGAIGLVLPALTRIKPILTAWAALGLLTIMVLAMGMHALRGEYGALPMNAILGGIAAFVAWGRFRWAPIAPRV
jgi:uncharacterized membrane protein YphA (DoxX/SURF4 family)